MSSECHKQRKNIDRWWCHEVKRDESLCTGVEPFFPYRSSPAHLFLTIIVPNAHRRIQHALRIDKVLYRNGTDAWLYHLVYRV